MRRDLGAVVPANEPCPWASIIGYGLVFLGGLASACGVLTLLIVMLGSVR